MAYENLVAALIGIGLLWIYSVEKDDLYKSLWLFAGTLFLYASVFVGEDLTTTVVSVGTTTYTYTLSNPAGLQYGAGILVLAVFIFWSFKLIKAILWGDKSAY